MKTAEEILCQFRIVSTAQRLVLLKLILRLEKSPFSVQDLNDRIRAVDLAVSHNTLVTTLLLFVTRKVLLAFPLQKPKRKKGAHHALCHRSFPGIPKANLQTAEATDKTESVKAMDFPLNEVASVKKNS